MGDSRSLGYATALALGFLTGCSNSAPQPEIQRWEIDAHETDIKSLLQRVSDLEQANNPPPLLLGDEGFTFVETSAGAATIEWTEVSANGNGSLVRLKIGNPSAATWNRYTIFGMYGPLDDDGAPDRTAGDVFEKSLSAPINGGQWTTISFQLDGARPVDLGWIDILSVQVTGISLLTPPE